MISIAIGIMLLIVLWGARASLRAFWSGVESNLRIRQLREQLVNKKILCDLDEEIEEYFGTTEGDQEKLKVTLKSISKKLKL